MPHIAIIILNWQQPKLTIKTVNSVLKIKHPNFSYHLFLLDNHSSDNSYSQFLKAFSHQPNISLFQAPTNLMFTAGNNFIINKISSKKYSHVLLLNNDVQVDPNFLQALVTFLNQHPSFGAVSPKIYFAPGYEYHPCPTNQQGQIIWAMGGTIDWSNVYAQNDLIDTPDQGQYQQNIINPDYLSGCCLLVKTSIIKKHLLDEKYWMYLEDVDLSQKIKADGHNLAVVASSRIWHLNAGSTRAGGGPLHDYFLTRNRLIFGFRYTNLKTKLALLRQSVIQLLNPNLPPWQRKGIIDFYTFHHGRGSWQN